jgi:hypothetical protein
LLQPEAVTKIDMQEPPTKCTRAEAAASPAAAAAHTEHVDVRWICDMHVHLYPTYDPLQVWPRIQRALLNHASSFSPPVQLAIFLTERADCHAFRELAEGRADLPAGWQVSPTNDAAALHILAPEGPSITVFAGRQIACRERVEILALMTDDVFEDGISIDETILAVQQARGLPVLGWSLGKWMFKRRPLADKLLNGGTLAGVGDSSLRPLGWGEPQLMRTAPLPVFAGTDPLPSPDEVNVIGRFGSTFTGPADPAALREYLHQGELRPERLGRRSSPLQVVRRLSTYYRSGKGSA